MMNDLLVNGLNLAELDDTPDGAPLEVLAWHSTANGNLPDADMTVLLWLRAPDGTADWAGGWWDGTDWRLCESGGVAAVAVSHWAEPAGPGA